MKARQFTFEVFRSKNQKIFGGALLKNSHAKEKRPITTKRAMHVVLRSSLARGTLSLLRKDRIIGAVIRKQGALHRVKVYRQANGGNHIHLIILPSSREAFHSFIRSVSGIIPRLILGAERGNPKYRKFWDKRPFSRIIEWGREFRSVSNYLLQNTLEALGFIPYQPRKRGIRSQKLSRGVASTA